MMEILGVVLGVVSANIIIDLETNDENTLINKILGSGISLKALKNKLNFVAIKYGNLF